MRVALDFDGVVTYNPLRVARLTVSFFKHRILRIKKLGFFFPRNRWQRWTYYLGIVIPSWYPAAGLPLLKRMARSSRYEFYLLTGRYGFVKKDTLRWLEKYDIKNVFKQIYINEKDEQPHNFKMRVISEGHFDYYIEDNLDIVRDLNSRRINTKVVWIYNILDGWRDYKFKFPYLEKALEYIHENSI